MERSSRVVTDPISTSAPPDAYLVSACTEMSTAIVSPPAADREGVEGDSGAPGVVERGRHAAPARDETSAARSGNSIVTDPGASSQTSFVSRADRRFERRRVHRVVEAVRDAPAGELVARELHPRTVGVVGDQHLVAASQQRHVDQRDRRQPAGHEQRLHAAFERRDALLEVKVVGVPCRP